MTPQKKPETPGAFRLYEKLIEPMRKTARALGYAIAVHGSLARDLDLVAIPWTESAACAHDLVSALMTTVRETGDGTGYLAGDSCEMLTGGTKPHGRRAWSIYLGGKAKTYIDLSVMPRAKP